MVIWLSSNLSNSGELWWLVGSVPIAAEGEHAEFFNSTRIAMSCNVVTEEASGLCVTLGTAFIDRYDDGAYAYRVCHAESKRVLPVKFARKRDAEAAMRAIADMTDWTQDLDAVLASIKGRGREIRQRMVEAMAW